MDISQYTAWLIGLILAISANIISNLGLNFQKKAHSRREAKKQSFNENRNENELCIADENENENKKQGSYVCDGVWLLGLCLQILGALLDFAALGYAPQSLVAPLGSLTLVVNVGIAPCMHKEKPSFKILLSTAIIIIGAGTTVASSPREDGVSSTAQVFELYENTSFLVYALLTGSFITVGWCLTQYYVYLSRNKQRRYKQKYYKQHRFVIAAISGTMGAQNVLFAKSVSVLVIKSIQNNGRILFAYWETYLLLAGLFSTIYFQLRWLNSGLKRFSALYVAPIFQAFWITVSVLGGLIVYKEFDQMLVSQKIVFPIGVITTISGVFYLTMQGKPIQKDQNTKKKVKPITPITKVRKKAIQTSKPIKMHMPKEREELMGVPAVLDASIVTGSSLGKLLLDPQNLYRHIYLGSNAEDIHYKDVLSPIVSDISDVSDLSENSFSKRKHKIRSQSDVEDSLSKPRKKKKRHKRRSRSVSPPLTTDEMAPHELVWEKIASIFTHDTSQSKEAQTTNQNKGYTSLEHTPEPVMNSRGGDKESIAYAHQQNQIIDLENDITIN